uniref:Uncharacterized protein n=1 Tax=Lactuca sativa TaxID=4236 RepID=A0A9R1VVL8_LACSA|nr:hypothetical protein LSAT_V11C400212090 [Lactuca sativa]
MKNRCSPEIVIVIEGKELKVTTQSVHEMLGIPNNGTILLYADKINSEALTVTCKRPTICYWSSKKIRYRDTFEQFSLRELNEEFFNEQVEGDTNLEDIDCGKDEDVFVERIKEKLSSKLNDAITTFPEKESFKIFSENITNIIVEDKSESKFFFEFPINETGLEGFNLTLVMGEKANDKKQNEDKKKGNGEEDNGNDGPEPKVDYFFDGNEAENEGTKNDGETNKKMVLKRIRKVKLKQKRKIDKSMKMRMMKRKMLLKTLWVMYLALDFKFKKEKDKIRNDFEMKIILDNIDIGPPLTGSKTNAPPGQKVYINKEEKLRKEKEIIHREREKERERERVISDKGKSEHGTKEGGEADKIKGNDGGGDKHEEIETTEANKDKSGDKQRGEVEKRNADDKDVVIQTKYSQETQRAFMESPYGNMENFAEVLHTWANLLNHPKLGRDVRNSPYRLFLKVKVSVKCLCICNISYERKYEKFKENFHDSTDRYKKILNIKDIDMLKEIMKGNMEYY